MRKSNAWYAARDARDSWELRDQFEELAEAAMAVRDTGDFDRLEIALDALNLDPEHHGFPALDDKMGRDARVAALAARYVSLSQFLNRMKRTEGEIEHARRLIGDEIRLACIETDSVPEYVKDLWKHVSAEGVGQKDIHPASRNLGKALAQAVRDHNVERRAQSGDAAFERYDDVPVASWSQLPRFIAGFELVDVDPGDNIDPSPCPLPPSTDMADFTVDRQRPSFGTDRRETYIAWGGLMADWALRTGSSLPKSELNVWAFLLAHRLPADQSTVKIYHQREFQSPWQEGGVVRIIQLTPEEWEHATGNKIAAPSAAKVVSPLADEDDDVPY
ncbi:hypothetical protein PQ455_02830 [Sphingomonas naphthae]|uniref:Uncharacterized protein n=1 Tax=Sphingomonas naphthae TaxID=1813468 RepID=A0ABY7TQQ8_9SPHN|nr:hypothetical protein [Sphingomonas naphthae]WCT74184.1 hypothetical protein PQ455_02830 [Sphingomonas naphthae]